MHYLVKELTEDRKNNLINTLETDTENILDSDYTRLLLTHLQIYKKNSISFGYLKPKDFDKYVKSVSKSTDSENINGLDIDLAENTYALVGNTKLKAEKIPTMFVPKELSEKVNGVSTQAPDTFGNFSESQALGATDSIVFEKTVAQAQSLSEVDKHGVPHSLVGMQSLLYGNKKWWQYIKGYIPVGYDNYVVWCKSWLLPILLALGVLFLSTLTTAGFITIINNSKPAVSPDTNNSLDLEDWDGEDPKSGKNSVASADMTKFPGYATIVVTRDMPEIELINYDSNKVIFEYIIKDKEGNILYTSSKIKPGKKVDFAIGRLYSQAGAYDLDFSINTYDVKTGITCTGVTMPVTLRIESDKDFIDTI